MAWCFQRIRDDEMVSNLPCQRTFTLEIQLSDNFFILERLAMIGPYLSQNHGPPRNHSQFLQVAWDRPIGWYPSCLTPPKSHLKRRYTDELQAAAAGLAPAEPLIVRVRWPVEMSKFFLTRREWCVYRRGFPNYRRWSEKQIFIGCMGYWILFPQFRLKYMVIVW